MKLLTSDHCKDMSDRQTNNSCFITNNPMNDSDKRKLVSLSKIGKKKFMNHAANETRMFYPGQEPEGFIQVVRG
jgi:hypothetical protein